LKPIRVISTRVAEIRELASRYMAEEKQPSFFSQYDIDHIDYKDVEVLKRFLTPHARIEPRVFTGASAREQRQLSRAIKRARFMALLPYVNR